MYRDVQLGRRPELLTSLRIWLERDVSSNCEIDLLEFHFDRSGGVGGVDRQGRCPPCRVTDFGDVDPNLNPRMTGSGAEVGYPML